MIFISRNAQLKCAFREIRELAIAFFSADLIPPVEICYLYGPTQYVPYQDDCLRPDPPLPDTTMPSSIVLSHLKRAFPHSGWAFPRLGVSPRRISVGINWKKVLGGEARHTWLICSFEGMCARPTRLWTLTLVLQCIVGSAQICDVTAPPVLYFTVIPSRRTNSMT